MKQLLVFFTIALFCIGANAAQGWRCGGTTDPATMIAWMVGPTQTSCVNSGLTSATATVSASCTGTCESGTANGCLQKNVKCTNNLVPNCTTKKCELPACANSTPILNCTCTGTTSLGYCCTTSGQNWITALNACGTCAAGTIWSNGACNECVSGGKTQDCTSAIPNATAATQTCNTNGTWGGCRATACAAGYYSADSGTSCIAVGSGYFSPADSKDRTACSTLNTGFTHSDAGAAAATDCYKTVTYDLNNTMLGTTNTAPGDLFYYGTESICLNGFPRTGTIPSGKTFSGWLVDRDSIGYKDKISDACSLPERDNATILTNYNGDITAVAQWVTTPANSAADPTCTDTTTTSCPISGARCNTGFIASNGSCLTSDSVDYSGGLAFAPQATSDMYTIPAMDAAQGNPLPSSSVFNPPKILVDSVNCTAVTTGPQGCVAVGYRCTGSYVSAKDSTGAMKCIQFHVNS